MLIALILGYLFLSGSGGGNPWFFAGQSSHEMKKEVAKLGLDSDKRKEVDNTLALIEKEYKKLQSERDKLEKETSKALENHGTTVEQFDALTQRADEINTTSSETLLDLRFALRNQLTAAQWSELFPAPPTATSH